ncbi:MAG: transporter substrate-binding domain-containing protein [Rhodobacteraceae bacterium]|nr:transporter substrate-binding domain-containing protein [Paracoccaceae bacterium]
MELSIPCRENIQIPQPTAFLALVSPVPEATQTVEPRFLAKAGETPFINHDSSGIIPDILGAALRAGGYQDSLSIARPNGISDVLQISIEPNALLSFPWTMPDCGDAASLSPQSIYMCNNYTFSNPLYEITLGIFTPADSPLATAQTARSFAGKTICVPQFHTADLLGQNGIAETSATIVLSPDFRSCLAGLETGNYDAMLADYQSFGSIVSPDSQLTDIPAFAQITTLHAVAYSQNPAAIEVLKMANAGLKEILISGEWFGIVNQHLSN